MGGGDNSGYMLTAICMSLENMTLLFKFFADFLHISIKTFNLHYQILVLCDNGISLSHNFIDLRHQFSLLILQHFILFQQIGELMIDFAVFPQSSFQFN